MQDVAEEGEREVAAGGVAWNALAFTVFFFFFFDIEDLLLTADENARGGHAEVVEHVVEERGCLGELARVRGPGGDVVVQDEGGDAAGEVEVLC